MMVAHARSGPSSDDVSHLLWIEDVLLALCGLVMIGSLALPWTRAGNGSTFSGHELVRTLRSGIVEQPWSWVPVVAIPAVALFGCFVLGTCPSNHRRVLVCRCSAGAALLGCLAVAVAVGALPVGNWGAGVAASATALVAACAISLRQVVRAERGGS